MSPDFWDLVDRLKEEAVGSPPGDGYFTTVQWAERYNIPIRTAREILARMVREGKLLVKSWQGWNYYTVKGPKPATTRLPSSKR